MEYLIILILQFIGIGFHVMQKVTALDDMHSEKNWKQVFGLFLKHDWDTLIVSGLVIALNIVGHYIVNAYAPEFTASISYYHIWGFMIALILGYGGQRLIYKYLGKAENFLDKKVGDKL